MSAPKIDPLLDDPERGGPRVFIPGRTKYPQPTAITLGPDGPHGPRLLPDSALLGSRRRSKKKGASRKKSKKAGRRKTRR